MAGNEAEKNTASKKVSAYIAKNKKVLIIVCVVLVAALVAYFVYDRVSTKTTGDSLAAIDELSVAFTYDLDGLEEAELAAKCADTLEAVSKYTSKGGVVGTRANMLAAEVAYNKKDYEAAVSYWTAAAEKQPKVYTAPLAYYNAATCYENLNQLDKAVELYGKACSYDDFILYAHAQFSYGRVLETSGKYADALTAYTELNDKCPDTNWAKIAKSRIISLQAEGKVE